MWPCGRQLLVAICATWVLFKCALAGFACLSNPCFYGICMDDLNSSYTCYCIDGYTGIQCQTNWDECWSSPCLNGGTCLDGVASFNCSCPEGFMGDECEQNFNECDSNPCLNNGTCLDGVNGYTCQCLPGYSGVFCETDETVCNATDEARCLHGGICKEGPGISFSCTCSAGWSGQLCEVPVDECSSSPCQNGAVCVDRDADYACACLFGYTGRNCEVKLHQCDLSPCQNGALCLVEGGVAVCYCVPDFHGSRCQFQYDECQLGPRCMNGGTCLDGVDNFTCSCPPNLTGQICECLIVGPDQLNCSYLQPAMPTTTKTTYPLTPDTQVPSVGPVFSSTEGPSPIVPVETQSHTEITKHLTPEIPSTSSQVPLPESSATDFTYFSTIEVTTIEYFSSPPSNVSGPPSPPTNVTPAILPETSPDITVDQTTLPSSEPTSSKSQTVLPSEETSYKVPYLSTTETFLTSEFSLHTLSTMEGVTDEPLTISTIVSTKKTLVDSSESTSQLVTTSQVPPISFSEESVLSTQETFPSVFTLTPYPESSTEMTTTKEILPPQSSEEPSSTLVTPRETSLAPPASSTEEVVTVIHMESTVPTSTDDQGVTYISHDMGTELPMTTEMLPTMVSEQFPVTLVSQGTSSEFPASSPFSRITPTILPTESLGTLEYEATTFETPESTLISTELTYSSELYSTTTEVPDCSVLPCLNGGTCIYTLQGTRCMCKLHWTGPLCEEHTGIHVAAFTGHSYLSHRLFNKSGTHVEVTARTLAPTGILLYAQLSSARYMCLYLEDGLLNFQFSCGLQTMLFTEVQLRVNNGFDLTIQAVLELLPYNGTVEQCSASLRINDSLAMSGKQVAASPFPGRPTAWLHLGGLPPQFIHHSDVPLLIGFTGCMQTLKVDNKTRNIYADALAGSDVTECSSLACLSNPCFGSGTCVEFKDHWNCLCPSGFVGVTCEQSVCDDNPCQFGATCVPFPGSGFLCLCPLGKHGLFCEHDLEIGQPAFSSSVAGLASYTAYALPGAIHHSMELKFRFRPATVEQIALMMFVGQDGPHDSRSDHLAVSFIKGYVVLTWNLGSGPRRIFTPRPVTQRANRPHTVRLGRVGQHAWLLVDNLGNVSGKSPGRLSQLNTRSVLYLGGHESGNFSLLPHDLPLHSGFSGCLFDVELRAGRVAVALQRTRPATGRGVGQCGTTECHEHACQHGGACLHHGATFTCLCAEGWFGPLCAQRYNPCDSTRHNCSAGSTCVPLAVGYECDCPLGKAGLHCERDETLSDVSFSGHRSYLVLPPVELHNHQTCLDLEVRPLSDRGLVLFAGQRDGRSFFSLSLQGGVLELRVAPGKPRKNGEALVIRSGRMLAIGEWHRVLAGRYGRRLFLTVDGSVNTGIMLPGDVLPPRSVLLYLGGVPDMSELPSGSVSGLPVSFSGCVRRLSVNWNRIALDRSHIQTARNLADCDGTACGGDVCEHGGTCWLDNMSQPHCSCPKQYSGLHCQTQLSCTEQNCQNQGRCVKESVLVARCHCPLGWGGAFCEEAVSVGSPHFGGDGYLVVQKPPKVARRQELNVRSKVDISFLYLNFSTAEPDGMILWSALGEEFLGVGVEAGILKLAWAWQDLKSHNMLVGAGTVADGAWHDLALSLVPHNITAWLDGQLVHSESDTDNEEIAIRPLNTDGVFYLGGFPEQYTVEGETGGLFSTRFSGCLGEMAWSEDNVITDFSNFQGENIGSCELFQP